MTQRRLLIATTLLLGQLTVQPTSAQQSAPTAGAGVPQYATTGVSITPTVGQPAGPQAVPGAPGAQPNALQQVPGQQAAPAQPPAPPFPIDPLEQQLVVQTLQEWERTSKTVNTFNSEFERWEYNAVWGPGKEIPLIKSAGTLSFSKPDKGSFKIEKIHRWTKTDPQSTAPDAPGDWVHQPDEIGEHWVCDGKAVYEYDHRDKQLVVTTIPEEMRGQNIVDGPLPFLFGADAQKLMTRYWIRTKTSNPEEIWLEAYPRWMSDAANYKAVDVMLDRKTMQPKAIQVQLPSGEERHVYMFTSPKVNEKNLGAWFTSLFSAPRTPLGWKKVMAEEVAAGQQAANPQAPVQR